MKEQNSVLAVEKPSIPQNSWLQNRLLIMAVYISLWVSMTLIVIAPYGNAWLNQYGFFLGLGFLLIPLICAFKLEQEARRRLAGKQEQPGLGRRQPRGKTAYQMFLFILAGICIILCTYGIYGISAKFTPFLEFLNIYARLSVLVMLLCVNYAAGYMALIWEKADQSHKGAP